MAGRQPHVLVEGEGADPAEIQAGALVPRRQFVIHRQGRGTGRQAQDGVGLAPEKGLHRIGGKRRDLPAAGKDDNFHDPALLVSCCPSPAHSQHAPVSG